MKGERFFGTLFVLVSCLVFALCFVGCDKGGDAPEPSVNGFEVQKSITVTQGDTVTLETPEVTDENGNVLEVYTDVVKNDENKTPVPEAQAGGTFTASDTCGYIIRYVVKSLDEQYVWRKETAVTVMSAGGSEDPGTDVRVDITVDEKYVNELVTAGQTVEINPQVTPAGTEIEVSVVKNSDSSSVTVTAKGGGKYEFTPDAAGRYTVTVAQKDNAANNNVYSLFAQKAMLSNEVEVFDETWKDRETFIGGNGKRADWQIVSNMQNRYGDEVSLAKIEETSGTARLYLHVRGDKSYYQDLADGFDCVSMWVYVDGSDNANYVKYTALGHPGGEGVKYALTPRRWTEIRCPLRYDPESRGRTFVDGMAFYEDYQVPFADITDLDDGATVYVDSVYAYKSLDITKKSGARTNYLLNQSCTLADMFESGGKELTYTVSRRGATEKTSGDTLLLDKVDSFVLSAYPKDRDYSGGASLAMRTDNTLVRLIGNNVSLPVSEISTLDGLNTGALTAAVKRVTYKNGERLTSATTATAAIDGADVKFTGLTAGDYCLEFSEAGEVKAEWLVSYDATNEIGMFDTDKTITYTGEATSAEWIKNGFSSAGITASGTYCKFRTFGRGDVFNLVMPLLHGNAYYEQLADDYNFVYSLFGTRKSYTGSNWNNEGDPNKKDHNIIFGMGDGAPTLKNDGAWVSGNLTFATEIPRNGEGTGEAYTFAPVVIDGTLYLRGYANVLDESIRDTADSYLAIDGVSKTFNPVKHEDTDFHRLTGSENELTLSNAVQGKLGVADRFTITVGKLSYGESGVSVVSSDAKATLTENATKLSFTGLTTAGAGDYSVNIRAFGKDLVDLTVSYDETDEVVFFDTGKTITVGGDAKSAGWEENGINAAGATASGTYGRFETAGSNDDFRVVIPLLHGSEYYKQLGADKDFVYSVFGTRQKYTGTEWDDHNVIFNIQDRIFLNNNGWISGKVIFANEAPQGACEPTLVDGALHLRGYGNFLHESIMNTSHSYLTVGFAPKNFNPQKYTDTDFHRLTGSENELTLSNEAKEKLSGISNFAVTVSKLTYGGNAGEKPCTATATVAGNGTKLSFSGLTESGDYSVSVFAYSKEIITLTVSYDLTDKVMFFDKNENITVGGILSSAEYVDGIEETGVSATGDFVKFRYGSHWDVFNLIVPLVHGNKYYENMKTLYSDCEFTYSIYNKRDVAESDHTQMFGIGDSILYNNNWFRGNVSLVTSLPRNPEGTGEAYTFAPVIINGTLHLRGVGYNFFNDAIIDSARSYITIDIVRNEA